MKRILKSEPAQRVLAALIATYMRLVFRLTRWTRINDEVLRERWSAGTPFIVCFWHGRMIVMPNFWPRERPIHLLASLHRDGRLILSTLAYFGAHPILGSSSRGGTRALREMVQAIRDGGSVCIAPDGPRGPRMRVSAGIVGLARIAGVPIIPVSFSTTRGRVLDTWDRFLLAFPFGRGVFICGEPLEVAAEADDAALEAARATLEARLNDITAEADRRCGRAPVMPAPEVAADPADARA